MEASNKCVLIFSSPWEEYTYYLRVYSSGLSRKGLWKYNYKIKNWLVEELAVCCSLNHFLNTCFSDSTTKKYNKFVKIQNKCTLFASCFIITIENYNFLKRNKNFWNLV